MLFLLVFKKMFLVVFVTFALQYIWSQKIRLFDLLNHHIEFALYCS